MRLVEYEVEIKKLVKSNRNNPEIYNKLQEMIKIFLIRKKVCQNLQDYEDMSYLLAGDLYMKIVNGDEISYYLGLLEKIYRKYAYQYYEEHSSEIVSLDRSVDSSKVMYGNSSSSCVDSFTTNKVYLQDINKVIDQIMLQSCKYDASTSAFVNLKLSLILSLLKGEVFCFHLDKEQEYYLRLILTNFHSKIIKENLNF